MNMPKICPRSAFLDEFDEPHSYHASADPMHTPSNCRQRWQSLASPWTIGSRPERRHPSVRLEPLALDVPRSEDHPSTLKRASHSHAALPMHRRPTCQAESTPHSMGEGIARSGCEDVFGLCDDMPLQSSTARGRFIAFQRSGGETKRASSSSSVGSFVARRRSRRILPALLPTSPYDAKGAAAELLTPSTSASCRTLSSRTSTPTSKVSCPVELGLKWTRGDNIGFGSFGMVFKAQLVDTGRIIAVKESRSSDDTSDGKDYVDTLRKELEICHNLQHSHIVRCLGHDYVDKRLFIYMEYVAGGSLRGRLNEFGPLGGRVLRKATRGLIKGLNYLHTNDPPVLHRDLKGANILVDEGFHVKLADFGCSKRDACTQSYSTIGSVHWMAPEVLNGNGYGRSIDIWSFGCVVIEMVTAEDPWGRNAFATPFQAMQRICFSEMTPPIPNLLPDDGRDLLCQCLQRNPADRPTTLQLIEHSFLRRSVAAQRAPFDHVAACQ